MDVGRFDRRIAIYRQTVTQDAHGEPVASEALVCTVWAWRMNQTVSQIFSGATDTTTDRTVWRIRWRADVLQQDVIVFEGRRFEITSLQEYRRREALDLVCERAGANV